RVGLDMLQLTGCRIEENEPSQIHVVALVGFEIDAAAVEMEAQRLAVFENAAGVDAGELVGVDTQDLLVAIVGDTEGESEISFQVEEPAGDLLGVLPHERALSGRDAEAVEIVPSLIAVVEPDVADVGLVLGGAVKADLDTLEPGKVACG